MIAKDFAPGGMMNPDGDLPAKGHEEYLPTEAERGVFTAITAYVAEHVPAEQHGAYAPAHIWGLVRAIRRAKPQAGVVEREALAKWFARGNGSWESLPDDGRWNMNEECYYWGKNYYLKSADALIASGLIRAVPTRDELAALIEGVTIRAQNFPHDVTISAGKNIDLHCGADSALSIADAIINLVGGE